MISIIVCGRHRSLLEQLVGNVQNTINSEYEILPIDNSHNAYSIFEAYNIGAQKAKGDILCFCHEDILFRTENWGNTIADIFERKTDIGLLGFAGTHFLADTPMYWFSSPLISEHNLTNDNGEIIECFDTVFYNSDNLAEVVAVDGFCFFIRKSLFNCISFDECSYKGFHLYDMDICMQVINTGHRVCVTKDILIEHSWSERDAGNKPGMGLFEKNLSIFCNKWKNSLPIYRGIDAIPESVLTRINILCKNYHEASKIRKSKAYRIGKLMLMPLKALRRKSK